jgi:UDP-glucuronate decarboxylase
MKETVLVAGGAGFIGSHLCDRLLELGKDVICLDSFFTGSKDNVVHLLGHPRFEVIRHDIVLPIHLEVDRIYNLACPASPVHYQYNPVKTILTNVVGTANLLELALASGARILQASTSEVYGDPEVHPQSETYWGNVNPIGPRACYDEGKRCAEALMVEHRRQTGVEVRIARMFNTYGPRMAFEDGRVVSNFIIQALAGEPLTVHGGGTQTRSFCYVSDMVDGLIALMECEECPGPVNLGNPVEVSIRALAELTIGVTGSSSVVEDHPLPQDDPRRRKPDITLARRLLGFDPKVGLEDGLRLTIGNFQARLDPPGASARGRSRGHAGSVPRRASRRRS